MTTNNSDHVDWKYLQGDQFCCVNLGFSFCLLCVIALWKIQKFKTTIPTFWGKLPSFTYLAKPGLQVTRETWKRVNLLCSPGVRRPISQSDNTEVLRKCPFYITQQTKPKTYLNWTKIIPLLLISYQNGVSTLYQLQRCWEHAILRCFCCECSNRGYIDKDTQAVFSVFRPNRKLLKMCYVGQNFTPVHSQVSKMGESKKPWVKYAPSPSSASPTASCLKRSAEELDSSLEVSPLSLCPCCVYSFDLQLLHIYENGNTLNINTGCLKLIEEAFGEWGAHTDSRCCWKGIFSSAVWYSHKLVFWSELYAQCVKLRLGMSPLSQATRRLSTSGVWERLINLNCWSRQCFIFNTSSVICLYLKGKRLNCANILCIVTQHPGKTHLVRRNFTTCSVVVVNVFQLDFTFFSSVSCGSVNACSPEFSYQNLCSNIQTWNNIQLGISLHGTVKN